MDRTRKMPVSISYKQFKTRKKEFLVPSPSNDGSMIGVTDGKKYPFGAITYIGVEITSDDIIKKMLINSIHIEDIEEYKNVLSKYIDEIYKYKISNIIESKLDENNNFLLLKIANWSQLKADK